jgi:predicted SnoaL-like aldol condensation-catalyzing enzyme
MWTLEIYVLRLFHVVTTKQSHTLIFINSNRYDGENFMQAQINNLSLNKRLAKECLDMIFNQHKVEQAVTKYIGANYLQHNPNATDGPDGIIAYATGYIKANPELRMEFKRIIAEGDLVAVHSFIKPNPSSLGTAVMDIFRVEDGKLVEHWDVMQPIPLKAENKNTMF